MFDKLCKVEILSFIFLNLNITDTKKNLNLNTQTWIWLCLNYPINVKLKGMKQQKLMQDVTYRNLAAIFGFSRSALSFFILSCHQIFNIQIDKKENICFSLTFESMYLKFKGFIFYKLIVRTLSNDLFVSFKKQLHNDNQWLDERDVSFFINHLNLWNFVWHFLFYSLKNYYVLSFRNLVVYYIRFLD